MSSRPPKEGKGAEAGETQLAADGTEKQRASGRPRMNGVSKADPSLACCDPSLLLPSFDPLLCGKRTPQAIRSPSAPPPGPQNGPPPPRVSRQMRPGRNAREAGSQGLLGYLQTSCGGGGGGESSSQQFGAHFQHLLLGEGGAIRFFFQFQFPSSKFPKSPKAGVGQMASPSPMISPFCGMYFSRPPLDWNALK